VLCDFFAPTSLSAFHASKLKRTERRKLHLDWRHARVQDSFRRLERHLAVTLPWSVKVGWP
jgi:hypothetical protein